MKLLLIFQVLAMRLHTHYTEFLVMTLNFQHYILVKSERRPVFILQIYILASDKKFTKTRSV